jgi:hypothetical protein
VEFDPFGFSVKDLPTNSVILCCNSTGKLYRLAPSPPEALAVTAPSLDLWHQRLGHPGRHALHQSLPSLQFTSTATPTKICDALSAWQASSFTFFFF